VPIAENVIVNKNTLAFAYDCKGEMFILNFELFKYKYFKTFLNVIFEFCTDQCYKPFIVLSCGKISCSVHMCMVPDRVLASELAYFTIIVNYRQSVWANA